VDVENTMLVRIIKAWDYPNLLGQTESGLGNWQGVQFTLEPVSRCDYVIVLNSIHQDIRLYCPPDNVWAVMQEPYVREFSDWMTEGHSQYSKVFTHHVFSKGKKYIPSFPMLPWHINKSFDKLNALDVPPKNRNLSWITSNKKMFKGHRERMCFLDAIKKSGLEIDLFGRGINEINDKWDGLSDYKYALAIENSQSVDYWTEKLSDCYLSYTMPIYCGAPNISNYFPKESLIIIDITKPNEAIEIICKAIENKEWEKNIEWIKKSRSLILNKYNFFSVIANKIKTEKIKNISKVVQLKPYKKSIKTKLMNVFYRLKSAL